MSMGRVSSNGVEERIGQLCSEFKLPTVGAEAGPRFTAAGHTDALHTLVEVLEQEAEDRWEAGNHDSLVKNLCRSKREIFDRTVKRRTPLGREQTPEDIGNLATFLASDYAKNITGQAINVSGGSHMH